MNQIIEEKPLTKHNKRLNKDLAHAALLEFQNPSVAITSAQVPTSARLTIWSLGSFLTLSIVAMALIPIDRVVTAAGRVISRTPTVVMQPLETSIVREIDVREGDRVVKGQVLAKLDPTFAQADAGALQNQVNSLGAEVDRLRSEASGQPYTYTGADPAQTLQASIYLQRQSEYNFKQENYSQKIRSLYATAQKAEGDTQAYRQRLGVASSVESMRKELEKDLVGSKLNSLSATDNKMEMQRGFDNATQTATSTKNDLAALIAEKDAYKQNWLGEVSQKLAEQSRLLSDAQENLNKAQLRKKLVELKAPEDAVILTLAKVSVGSVLQSGDPFITMVPTDAPLEIEANISGKDNGFVHSGDPVAIKFDTFPYSQYGKAAGVVRTISADSFTAADDQRSKSASNVPVQPNSVEPFYRTRITLDQVNLHNVPANFHVTPGMPVTTDIKVGERTVLGFMLGKVLPITSEAMREP